MAASSPLCPPLLCLDLHKKRMDSLKKLGYIQVGAMKSLLSRPLRAVSRSPISVVLKAESSEKENMKAVLAYISSPCSPAPVRWLRKNDECKVICGDVVQDFRELEGLEKKDLIATCTGASAIYKSNYIGTSMDPLVTAKWYILENPVNRPEGMCMMIGNPVIVPTQPEYFDFDIVKIAPVSIDGQELSLATLLAKLNTVGGKHGIGLIDMDENQLDGMMSRGVYNTSGGTIMWHTVRELESLSLARVTMQQKDMLTFKIADLVVHSGPLSDQLREAINIFKDMITETTIGSVQIKVYRGSVTVTQGAGP